MSHVRRKPPKYPIRATKKKKKNKQWASLAIIVLIFLGLMIGIVFLIISTP